MIGIAGDLYTAAFPRRRQNAAADAAIGAGGADRRHDYAAACLTTAARKIRMRPATTFTGTVGTQPLSGAAASPVASEIFQSCNGQATLSPWTMPWLSGPPLCGQRLTSA